jgi:hypothetical protein
MTILAALLGAICLPGAAADAGGAVMNAVSETVQVESRNGKVLVRLSFNNQSGRTVYVPRSVASDTELFGNWFELRDSSNGDPIAYIGPTVKRAPLGKDDFLAVKPHTKRRNTIDITQAYAFMQGRHTYQLTYAGHYVADLKMVEQTTPVEPASAMFAHVGN